MNLWRAGINISDISILTNSIMFLNFVRKFLYLLRKLLIGLQGVSTKNGAKGLHYFDLELNRYDIKSARLLNSPKPLAPFFVDALN